MFKNMGFTTKFIAGLIIFFVIVNLLTCILLRELTHFKKATQMAHEYADAGDRINRTEILVQNMIITQEKNKRNPGQKAAGSIDLGLAAPDLVSLTSKDSTAAALLQTLKNHESKLAAALNDNSYPPLLGDFRNTAQELKNHCQEKRGEAKKYLLDEKFFTMWSIGSLTVAAELIGLMFLIFVPRGVIKQVRKVIKGLPKTQI